MIAIRFSRRFRKQYQKADKDIRKKFDARMDIFLVNPLDPTLHNHALKGMLLGFRSINITGDWRALYREENNAETVIIFEALGTHSQLYE